MTESDDDYGGDQEHEYYQSRRNRISSSMQRSIDRLLGCTIGPGGKRKVAGEDDAVID